MTNPQPFGPQVGTSAAEHLSPSFPERAARGTADKLRAWQQEAFAEYFLREPKDFLVAATPGAGKTTFALRLVTELLAQRKIDRVTVVAPTEHLKRQWADAAHRVGVRLDPSFKNAQGWAAKHFHGVAVTYAQVATRAALHRSMTEGGRTLVILDEVHHGGDALSWGDAIREAFEPAIRRLSLTGTPFRSDTSPIPFVTYYPDEHGIRTSQADYAYGYGRALADGVVRPVIFLAYAGRMRWRTRTGDEMEARLGEGDTKDITAQAWRTALDPKGEWVPAVLRAANRRLTEVRHGIPDAGGLVIATDHYAARAYADILEKVTGEKPTVVLSDEKAASDRIAQFAVSDSRWMVAVRMVSEGVDIPRLGVGVYATSASTPCSSPRPSAALCARDVGGRRRRSSSRVCHRFLGSPRRWSCSAIMRSTGIRVKDSKRSCLTTTPQTRPIWSSRPLEMRCSSTSRRSVRKPLSIGCCSTGTSSARARYPTASKSSISSVSPVFSSRTR